MPDSSIFSTTEFKYNIISERLNESAFLLKEVTISLEDKRTDEKEEFHYEDVYKRQLLDHSKIQVEPYRFLKELFLLPYRCAFIYGRFSKTILGVRADYTIIS